MAAGPATRPTGRLLLALLGEFCVRIRLVRRRWRECFADFIDLSDRRANAEYSLGFIDHVVSHHPVLGEPGERIAQRLVAQRRVRGNDILAVFSLELGVRDRIGPNPGHLRIV